MVIRARKTLSEKNLFFGNVTRHALLAVLVALLIVLAGCNAFGVTDSPPESATSVPTVRPTPTEAPDSPSTSAGEETTTGTAVAGSYPPGVSGDGISAPFSLASAHEGAIDNRSYTVRTAYEIRYHNGTVYAGDRVAATVGPGDDSYQYRRYRYRRSVYGKATGVLGATNGTIHLYANGSVVFRRIVAGTNATEPFVVRDVNGDPVPPHDVFPLAPYDRIGTAFSRLSNVSVERVNDSTYRVRATESATESVRIRGFPIRNVSLETFTATITANGLVRKYRYRRRGTVEGHAVTVTKRYRYADVGNTTVEAPPWYDQAVENGTATANASLALAP
ncbi:MAG: hypothetical protein ACI9YT_000301 [Halobacteriales archaeon]|jgi:hypothetical protein